MFNGHKQTVIDYDNNPDLLGDWRNNLLFVADDEDTNGHLNDADGIANIIDTTYVNFNIDKIYLDAFQQISTPGGEKYPSVTEGLNKAVFKGLLVMNYLGHGGSTGWTQERVLKNKDIENENLTNLIQVLKINDSGVLLFDGPEFDGSDKASLLKSIPKLIQTPAYLLKHMQAIVEDKSNIIFTSNIRTISQKTLECNITITTPKIKKSDQAANTILVLVPA